MPDQETVFSTILDADTRHRGWRPTDDQISTLLDITEA